MQVKLMDSLVCPSCLNPLELKDALFEDEKKEIIEGNLFCKSCKLNFVIKDGIPVFGISEENKYEIDSEMEAEIEWEITTEMNKHLKWAEDSAIIGERLIKKIKQIVKDDSKRVLDIGSGIGSYHSWQLVKHGFEVVATELCPEFLFSINYFTEDMFFERVISDGYVLPFRNNSFDIVFCKELIHHLDNPTMFLNEIWRVLKPNGVIAIIEPCISERNKNKKNASGNRSSELLDIMHHNYTFKEYITYLRKIAKNIKIDGEMRQINSSNHPLISKAQKILQRFNRRGYLLWLNKFLYKKHLVIRGGIMQLTGLKRKDYLQKKYNRKVIPISLERLDKNTKEIDFYCNQLIPKQLQVFSDIHKKEINKDWTTTN